MANAKIKHLQLPNGTTYDFHAVTADSATTTTTSTYLSVPRVAKDSKSLPGANKCIVEEYTMGTNYNLPSNAFYHIYSSQGTDTKYGCQLALGMTTEAAYYRIYNNQSWKDWKSIINTWRPVQNNLTSDSTSDSLSAAQGKALANGSARDNTKVAKSGDTMTGTLKLGSSTQSAFPTTGIQVHDVRSVNFTPGALDQGANFFFSNNTMPNTNWWAGLHVKGWTGAYAAWEIVGSAHSNDARTTPLYVRSSNRASTWGSWRKIYDTSNPPTKSEVGLGNVDNTADANKSVSYATTSGTATGANKLNSIAAIGTASQTHAQALKTYFDANKTTIPRNVGINFYSSAYNQGANCFGYFLNGHNDNPYGGFFISHYDKAYYVGVNSGNYTQNLLGRFTADPTSGQVIITDGTTGGIKSSGYTIAKSVPSDAKFTDTNTHRPIQMNGTEILGNNTTVLNLKAGSNITLTNSSGTVTIAGTANNAVTQTKTTTDANYDILFSVSTSGTDTKVEGARKSDKIKFNPSQQTLTIGSGNDESVISNVDIKAKQYELRSPDKTLLVKMKLDNTGQTAILAEDSEGTMLWYNNYINSDGTLQWNNPITCSEAFSCASFLSGQIELKQASPYIDFHHNNSTADFTSRIITTNLAELTFYGKNSSGTTVYGTCRGAAFTVVSSKYMKENIKDIEDDEAKKLLQLRPVSFDYKYTGETNKRGLIAEEVLEVMPEMVYVPEDYSEPMDDTIPDNVPSIDYSKFVPYLIKMVQIQQKEIDELKARI